MPESAFTPVSHFSTSFAYFLWNMSPHTRILRYFRHIKVLLLLLLLRYINGFFTTNMFRRKFSDLPTLTSVASDTDKHKTAQFISILQRRKLMIREKKNAYSTITQLRKRTPSLLNLVRQNSQKYGNTKM